MYIYICEYMCIYIYIYTNVFHEYTNMYTAETDGENVLMLIAASTPKTLRITDLSNGIQETLYIT